MAESKRIAHEPYCSNCGYVLTGLTESSRCPECGRPFVEVLTRAPRSTESGKRYRSRARLCGMPAVDIAFGPRHGEPKGKARGFLAIGDDAVGVVAIGGAARGVVAVGGAAVGVFSMGGGTIGLGSSVGGGALGGVAVGGGAVGLIAKGGGALGLIADGGTAVGYIARGGGVFGVHTIGFNAATSSPAATAVFDSLTWLLGSFPPSVASVVVTFTWMIALTLAVGAALSLFAWRACKREPGREEPNP